MSEEEADNKPVEKPTKVISQEVSQDNQQQESPPISKQIEIREFAGKAEAGDQGVFFSPTIDINTPDPFVSQDIVQSQPTPVQTITPLPSAEQTIPTLPSAQSGGGDSSDSGE